MSSVASAICMPTREGQLAWLGSGVGYTAAWRLQKRLAAQRADGLAPDTLLLLEHASVYTEGRRAVPEHVLAELGAPLVEADRGGQTTYHGPGQLVGYPIVSLHEAGFGPRGYVVRLQEAIVEGLATLGVEAWHEPGVTAVWSRAGKIAAIGVKVARGVTLHGFALNVSTDLAAFDPIVPCGIHGRPVSSIASTLGASRADEVPAMTHVRRVLADALGERLGLAWEEVPAAGLSADSVVE